EGLALVAADVDDADEGVVVVGDASLAVGAVLLEGVALGDAEVEHTLAADLAHGARIGAGGDIRGAGAEAEAGALARVRVDVPAHGVLFAGVEAVEAGAEQLAGLIEGVRLGGDRDAGQALPRAVAVERDRHALLSFGAVLVPDVAVDAGALVGRRHVGVG